MRSPRITIFVLILVVGIAAGGPDLHAARHLPTSGEIVVAAMPEDSVASVSGTVADGSSNPLAGATVLIKSASGASQTATTDSKGKYKIGGLAPGTYTISVAANGFKDRKSTRLNSSH